MLKSKKIKQSAHTRVDGRLRVHLILKPAMLVYAKQYAKIMFDGNLSEAVEDIIVQVAGPEYLKLAHSIKRIQQEKATA